MNGLNLVLIHTHDTGRFIQPYGAPVACPSLMRLAREGTLMRRAFCTSPGCSPSRSSLLTGQWPHTNGMIGLAHRGFSLHEPRHHLSHRLSREGYFCKLIGVQHEARRESELGYHEGNSDALSPESLARARMAAHWIEQCKDSRPFFLNLGLWDTHRPYAARDPEDDPRYVAPLPFCAEDADVREDIARLHSAVRRVDQAVGVVLDALDGAGLASSTLVVFTTDHGLPFPRAKATLFDAGTGVSWIMRGGPFPVGQVLEAPVSQLDFVPTFWEAADLGVPQDVQGQSLLRVVRGEEERPAVFSEITFHAAHDPARAVRTPRFKYIRFFKDYPRVVWPNVDASPSKDLLHRSDPLAQRPREMLFDLVADPQEFENVAEREHYSQVLAQMRARLDSWMRETNDPLLDGPIELPEGAIATPVENYNP